MNNLIMNLYFIFVVFHKYALIDTKFMQNETLFFNFSRILKTYYVCMYIIYNVLPYF